MASYEWFSSDPIPGRTYRNEVVGSGSSFSNWGSYRLVISSTNVGTYEYLKIVVQKKAWAGNASDVYIEIKTGDAEYTRSPAYNTPIPSEQGVWYDGVTIYCKVSDGHRSDLTIRWYLFYSHQDQHPVLYEFISASCRVKKNGEIVVGYPKVKISGSWADVSSVKSKKNGSWIDSI